MKLVQHTGNAKELKLRMPWLTKPYDFTRGSVCDMEDVDAERLIAENPMAFKEIKREPAIEKVVVIEEKEEVDEDDKPFVCDCGKAFKLAMHLGKHKKDCEVANASEA